jgi:TPP-dependent pyruvate/acetoin dehydrogenase alpha subunit
MTPAFTREQGLELLRHMLRIRRFEERTAELYQLGKIHGFLHLYIGEEAVAAGSHPVVHERGRDRRHLSGSMAMRWSAAHR